MRLVRLRRSSSVKALLTLIVIEVIHESKLVRDTARDKGVSDKSVSEPLKK